MLPGSSQSQSLFEAPAHEGHAPTARAIAEAPRHVATLLAAGTPPHVVLTGLVRLAEALAGDGSTCSILVLGKDGLLHDGCSPGLPPDYLEAIDNLRPHPELGTCAAAAATGSIVYTPDFRGDSKWAELRHLPMALGYVGAWSVPIKSGDGTVLGTFGTYFRERRMPREAEQEGVQRLAEAAALVLERAGR